MLATLTTAVSVVGVVPPAHANAPITADAYQFSIVAGRPYVGPGPATDSAVMPSAVTVDSAGNTYVADGNSGRVEKVTPDGTLSFVAGSGTQQSANPGLHDIPQPGPALASAMTPVGVAVDAADNLYIADAGGWVEKVTPSGTLSILAGRGVVPGWPGPTPGPAVQSAVSPASIAVSPAGDIYVGDGHNVIVKIADGTLSIVAGNGWTGTPTPGPATSTPVGVGAMTLDAAGNLFVVNNPYVEKITPTGDLSIVVGPLNSCSTALPCPATSFSVHASGITLDSSGEMFLASGLRVYKVDTQQMVSVFAGYEGLAAGQQSFPPKPGPATSSPMMSQSLAMDPQGNLVIGDYGLGPGGTPAAQTGYLERVTPNGELSVYAGDANGDPVPGPATLSPLRSSGGVVADASGNIYIAQWHRIVKVTPDGTLSVFAGDGTVGTPVPGPAQSSPIAPEGLAIDDSGNVYATDPGGYVFKITPAGTLSIIGGNGQTGPPIPGTATSSPMSPIAATVDTAGNVYVASNQDTPDPGTTTRILKIAPDGSMAIIAGAASGNPVSLPAPAATSPFWTNSIAVDPSGNLYAAVSGAGIYKISTDGTLSNFAGNGYTRGVPTPGPAVSSSLSPAGIATDSAGNVFVADDAYVDRITPSGVLSVVAGDGAPGGYSGNYDGTGSGWGIQVALSPTAIAVSADGTVYTVDRRGFAAKLAPTAGNAPSAPTNVLARSGAGGAWVQFAPSMDTGGLPVTSYTVDDGSGHSCSPALVTQPDQRDLYNRGNLSCWVSNLTPGSPAAFTVTATNAAGTSAPSSASNSVTPFTTPSAPQTVTAVRDPAGTAANISWAAPANDGWSPITGYAVSSVDTKTGDRATPCAGYRLPYDTTSLTPSCHATGLMNGHTYTFTVQAINAAGTGQVSESSGPVTPATVPAQPFWPSALAGNRSVRVGWTTADADGAPITSFTVTATSASDGVLPPPITVPAAAVPGGGTVGASTYVDVPGLTNGTAYTFVVTATNTWGDSPASATTNAVTPTSGPTTTVIGVPLVGATLTAVTPTTGSTSTTYQWRRNGVALPGETGASHLLVGNDVGATVTVVATSSTPGSLPTTASVSISGVALPMTALTVSADRPTTVTLPLSGRETFSFLPNSQTPRGIAISPAGKLTATIPANNTSPFTGTFRYATHDPSGATHVVVTTISVAPGALYFRTTHMLPTAKRGTPYSAAIITGRGWGSSDRFILASGALPPGMSLTHATGGQYARVAGRPTRAGNYRFVIRAVDTHGHAITSWFAISVR